MGLLPERTTKPSGNIDDYTILVYGESGVGKTTFSNGAPKPIILDFEDGTKGMEAYRVQIGSWENFKRAITELLNEKHDFQTVVIDTLSNGQKMCDEYICKRERVSSVDKVGYGKGHGYVLDEIIREFNRIKPKFDMDTNERIGGFHTLVMCHQKVKVNQPPEGEAFDELVPELVGKLYEKMPGMVDCVLHAGYAMVQKKKSRVLRVSDYLMAKTKDRSGRLPSMIRLEYAALAKAFKEKVGITEDAPEEPKRAEDGHPEQQELGGEPVMTA
ncbi:ATP-binding protein [bacterium]|nr:ATP-binding protein [bacterium]